MPGVIQEFDATKQTVKVQLAIRERINLNLVPTDINLPLLVDVPIVLPRGGGFSVTVPVAAGDECLVVFGDMCIDAWWQSGGTENAQSDKRRHDLSDAFAVMAPWSQPRVLSNYSTDALQIRSDDGNTVIEIDNTGKISLTSQSEIDITAPTIKINGSTLVDIDGGNTKVDGKVFLTHKHSGVQTGGGQTGGVV
jgi:hypothetical protein